MIDDKADYIKRALAQDKDMQKRLESGYITSEDAEKYLWKDFLYCHLNFCGCGSPESVLQVVVEDLKKIGAGNVYDFCYSDPRIEFCFHQYENAGLITHGTSVGCSFLSPLGEEFLAFFREMTLEDMDTFIDTHW